MGALFSVLAYAPEEEEEEEGTGGGQEMPQRALEGDEGRMTNVEDCPFCRRRRILRTIKCCGADLRMCKFCQRQRQVLGRDTCPECPESALRF